MYCLIKPRITTQESKATGSVPELNIALVVASFLSPSSFATSPRITLHAHLALRSWLEFEAERIKVRKLHECTEDSFARANHAGIEGDSVGARTEHRFDCGELLVPVKLRDLAPNNIARPSCTQELLELEAERIKVRRLHECTGDSCIEFHVLPEQIMRESKATVSVPELNIVLIVARFVPPSSLVTLPQMTFKPILRSGTGRSVKQSASK